MNFSNQPVLYAVTIGGALQIVLFTLLWTAMCGSPLIEEPTCEDTPRTIVIIASGVFGAIMIFGLHQKFKSKKKKDELIG